MNVFLLLGLSMMMMLSGCSTLCHLSNPPKSAPPTPDVVFVNKDDIKKNEDGSYTVCKAWMLKRMKMEERLTQTLKICKEEYTRCRDYLEKR